MDATLIAPLTLAIEYGAVAIYVLTQIVVLLLQRHAPLHYKSIFNWLSLFWMALRAVFWGLQAGQVNYSSVLDNFIFWLPSCIDFLTFCTLALFLTKVVMGRAWQRHTRTRALAAFGSVAALDVVGSAVLSVLTSQAANADRAQLFSDIEAVFTALLFALLAAVFAVLGWRLAALSAWELHRMFIFSPATVAGVTWALAAIFGSRALYNAVSAAGAVTINVDSTSTAAIVETVMLYTVWEIAPVVMLLATIATGPQASQSVAIDPALLKIGVFGAIAAADDAEANRRGGGAAAACGFCCGSDGGLDDSALDASDEGQLSPGSGRRQDSFEGEGGGDGRGDSQGGGGRGSIFEGGGSFGVLGKAAADDLDRAGDDDQLEEALLPQLPAAARGAGAPGSSSKRRAPLLTSAVSTGAFIRAAASLNSSAEASGLGLGASGGLLLPAGPGGAGLGLGSLNALGAGGGPGSTGGLRLAQQRQREQLLHQPPPPLRTALSGGSAATSQQLYGDGDGDGDGLVDRGRPFTGYGASAGLPTSGTGRGASGALPPLGYSLPRVGSVRGGGGVVAGTSSSSSYGGSLGSPGFSALSASAQAAGGSGGGWGVPMQGFEGGGYASYGASEPDGGGPAGQWLPLR